MLHKVQLQLRCSSPCPFVHQRALTPSQYLLLPPVPCASLLCTLLDTCIM